MNSIDDIFMKSIQHIIIDKNFTNTTGFHINLNSPKSKLVKMLIFSGFKTPSRRSGEDEERDRGSPPKSSE